MSQLEINIVSVNYIDAYRLHLIFNDATEHTIDFEPFLSRAQHPDIRRYLNKNEFKNFHLAFGELVWGDYEMCFPVINLYRNHINAHYCDEATV